MHKTTKRLSAQERAQAAQHKTTLTGADVAAIARITPKRAYQALERGQVPGAYRRGRWYRVTYQQALTWVALGCPDGSQEP